MDYANPVENILTTLTSQFFLLLMSSARSNLILSLKVITTQIFLNLLDFKEQQKVILNCVQVFISAGLTFALR